MSKISNIMVKSIIAFPLDEKDHLILHELKKDGKASSQQLSKRTRLPISTIHNRIKRMEASGAIKGYTIMMDEKRTGMILAYVLITVDYHPADGRSIDQYDLAKKIRNVDCVMEVGMTTGSSDIFVKVQSRSIQELNEFVTKSLRSFQGVDKTQTLVVLNSL